MAGWADVVEANASDAAVRRCGSSASWARARRPRSRSAGCSSAGGAGTRCRRRRAPTGGAPPCRRPGRDRARRAREASRRLSVELEPDRAEGRSWYGGPGAGELVEWRPILERAGVDACPNRVAAVYLELAVLVRALQGLDDAARLDAAPDRSSLWAGLFDLHDTLYGATVDDLRALAA